MRTLVEFNKKYHGETIYIIGSGPSIRDVDFSLLSDKITIAVNSGYCAFEKATLFLSDDWSVSQWSYFNDDLVKSKHTTVLLYEKMLSQSCGLFGYRSVFFRHRNGYYITDEYSHTNKAMHILQSRTSLGSAIHVAHIMGASKIVLLGVDCCRVNGYRYFWQFPDFVRPPVRSDHISVDNFKRCYHNDQQTDVDLMDILNYWEQKGRHFLDKCNVYNASDISVINVFPKVKLKSMV